MDRNTFKETFESKRFKSIKIRGKYTVEDVVTTFVGDSWVIGVGANLETGLNIKFILSIATFEDVIMNEGEFVMEEVNG